MITTPTDHGRRQSLFSAEFRRSTLALAALPFLVAFEMLAVSTVMPRAAEELGGVALYPLVFAAPPATSILSTVLAGAWCDRHGPMRVMTAGCVVFCAALLMVGLAPSMPVLVAGRGLQGLGMGLVTVSLYVLIARLYPPRLQPRMFTVLSAAWVVPGLVGPALAGWISDTVGWRVVFWVVPLLVVPARLLLTDPTGAASAPRNDAAAPSGDSGAAARRLPVAAAIIAAVGIGALSMAGEQVSQQLTASAGGLSSGLPAGLAGWVVVMGVALLAVLATVPRLLPRRVLLSPDHVGRLILARGVLAASFVLAEVYLPLQLVARYGLSAGHAGLVLTVSSVTWFVGASVAGRDAMPEQARIPVGAAAMTIGTTITALLLLTHQPPWLAGVSWCLTGLGMGLAFTSTSILTMRRSHPTRQGLNSSTLQVAEALTQSAMLALAGVAFQVLLRGGGSSSAAPYAAMFAAAILLAALGALVGAAVRPRRRGRARRATVPS
ncbi:MFS transporter [Brachybacterium epidermidis]|uniref:MFS transporter n=1 Tax=Brachybacterium epidermidis TaxID=2781983 RepID=UPI00398E78FC